VVTYKEDTPISGNLTFQVSPRSSFAVNDLHKAYLSLEVERTFSYTNSAGGAIAAELIIFFGDKHTGNFIKQFRICCNDNIITEILDFVYETNILGSTIPDSIKLIKPETYTPITNLVPSGNLARDIEDKERACCGQYINLNDLNVGNTIIIKYFINIPMTTFNLFDKFRYLTTFLIIRL
jgi:hypothetical protein